MLQLIAMITMLLDHIGFIFNNHILQCIGRLSVPIYAYFIVYGVFKTKDIKNYICRLMILAFVSQVQWLVLFKVCMLNIIFLWCLSAWWLYFVKNRHKSITRLTLLFIGFVISYILPIEGSIYAYAWICFFYCFFFAKYQENAKDYYIIFLMASSMIIIIYSCISCNVNYYLWSFASIPVIWICDIYNKQRFNNKIWSYSWRMFYPLHLLCLAVINYV